MTRLSLDDIKINDSSYVDPNGFLFAYKGDLYRAIYPVRESFYLSLFDKGIIDKLIKNHNLVSSEITDYKIPELNCNLVIRHEKIEPLTYCVEWCPSMLKSAAVATLELNAALLEYNCCLQDAYPWNILFKFTKPVFIDLTSIVPIEGNLLWPAYQQFINCFLNPLKLASMGKGSIARGLLYDYINGISVDQLNINFTLSYIFRHPLSVFLSYAGEFLTDKIQKNFKLKKKFQNAIKNSKYVQVNNKLRMKFTLKLLKKVEKINLSEGKTTWKNYYYNINEEFKMEDKEKIISNLLSELSPDTVLDLGSNVGKFSIIACQNGARVISIDSSEYCVQTIYNISKEKKYDIIPLVGDIVTPTPSYGFLSRQFPPMVQRVKSDVVLCLGLMHHLHINSRQSFDRIALMLNELSNKAVIFEYVDFTDDNINLLDHGREISYSIETVSKILSKYFSLSYYDSDRATRKLILCRK